MAGEASIQVRTRVEEQSSLGRQAKDSRLVWLDILRLSAALMIVGFHWLRACYKVQLFGTNEPVNLVVGYQGQTIGLHMIPYVLIAGTRASPATWLTNIIGILGGFGWQGVSALIIVSGFSLTLALKGRTLTRQGWIAWFRKRATRILVPFYLVALPFLLGYVGLLTAVHHMHGALAKGLDVKLHSLLQGPILGTVLSHTLLFDPFERQWQANFFSSAWWFIPAILIAYLAYPGFLSCMRWLGSTRTLLLAAAVTMLSYFLADMHFLLNESCYFIVLQESFNFTLGIWLGKMWLNPQTRHPIEQALDHRTAVLVGLLLFCAGNLANWSPATRVFASMLYGPGLFIMLTVIGRSLEKTAVARIATSIDSYDLYLVHQPVAFPVALAAKMLLHGYTVFVGWFVFLGVASGLTLLLAAAQRLIFRPKRAVVN